MIKKLMFLIILAFLSSTAIAQPFLLKSVGIAKPFSLNLYYGTDGKGAFVQYVGQQGVISLKLKSRTAQGNAAQLKANYVWNEVIKGKVTGTYGLTQQQNKITEVWYKSNKNGKTFELKHVPDQEDYGGMDKYLLHGVLVSFRHTADQVLIFSYPDGSTKTSQLPGFDHPDPQRNAIIADYNFDGYDDVAFSIPDAGMGVYRTFSIYLYNPKLKRFQLLAEPNSPNANCSGLCDVTLDQKNKLLLTACRGAATWWQDVYKFSTTNRLTYLRSSKKNQ